MGGRESNEKWLVNSDVEHRETLHGGGQRLTFLHTYSILPAVRTQRLRSGKKTEGLIRRGFNEVATLTRAGRLGGSFWLHLEQYLLKHGF